MPKNRRFRPWSGDSSASKPNSGLTIPSIPREMRGNYPFLPLHPLQPGPTRGEGAEEELELKKQIPISHLIDPKRLLIFQTNFAV